MDTRTVEADGFDAGYAAGLEASRGREQELRESLDYLIYVCGTTDEDVQKAVKRIKEAG